MKKLAPLFGVTLLVSLILAVGSSGQSPKDQSLSGEPKRPGQFNGYAGSVSCRECHERFYQLWSTSRHGLAMQPYTADFPRKNLTPQPKEVQIGKASYRADIAGETGWVLEKKSKVEKKYRIEHALGGKNVYYFLTPFPGPASDPSPCL